MLFPLDYHKLQYLPFTGAELAPRQHHALSVSVEPYAVEAPSTASSIIVGDDIISANGIHIKYGMHEVAPLTSALAAAAAAAVP